MSELPQTRHALLEVLHCWSSVVELVSRRTARMSIFPITPLARRVQAIALQTFDVSEEEASDYAAMMVALAEDHGGPEKAAQLDWDYRIKKDGSAKKWRWRSEDERVSFETAQKERHEAYEVLIPKRHT